MGSEVTPVTLPEAWLGLWSLQWGQREATLERTFGVLPFDPQVKSGFDLGPRLSTHYVEMVGVGGAL